MSYAVQYEEFGPPEVLRYVEIPLPEPGPGEVLVEIRAAGVNPLDGKLRSGLRSSAPITTPRRVGFDGAGIVAKVGEGTSWQPGDEVILRDALGTYASHLVVTPDKLVRKPANIGFEQAAALGIPVATAYQVLKSLNVGEGNTLLLHGGSGAVGQAVIQLAQRQGATVIATASSTNHPKLRELGATPVEYGDGLSQRVRQVAPQGVDYALDLAGTQEAIEVSQELVADPQHIGTIVNGAQAADWGIRAWLGGSPNPLTQQEQEWRIAAIPEVVDLIAEGKFKVEVSQRYPLYDAAAAHRQIETGHTRGKIVIIP